MTLICQSKQLVGKCLEVSPLVFFYTLIGASGIIVTEREKVFLATMGQSRTEIRKLLYFKLALVSVLFFFFICDGIKKVPAKHLEMRNRSLSVKLSIGTLHFWFI